MFTSVNHRRLLFSVAILLLIFVTACFSDLSLWDVEWAKSAPLNVEVKSEITEMVEGTALILREIRYNSHEWKGETIWIAAHLAMPETAKETLLPGWLNVTGGMNDAKKAAVQHQVVALSIDRVGSGKSTGPPDGYIGWLDVEADPKDGMVKVKGDRTVQLTLKEGEKGKLVYFVEVEYKAGYYLTSVPHYAEGLKPRIRPAPSN